ncbi:MAG: hypothetical protein ABIR96_05355 [Bdellovibrionota bacterium]
MARSSLLFRRIWHDAYYAVSGKPGLNFAMLCRDVAEMIDLKTTPTTLVGKVRFKLHLSLCQACWNYSEFSKRIQELMKLLVEEKAAAQKNAEALNQDLLKTFSKSEN